MSPDASTRHPSSRPAHFVGSPANSPMIEIELDGQKVEVPEGSMVMHAADKAGAYIPHFCYHKKLSIAANCRMCLVDVEKAPKPMPACATPVTKGMIVRTKSDKALKAQQGVMEFLLINHPLDCPICDQGGECQLQDLAVGYGASSSRYDEEKRVVLPKDFSPLISAREMNRCIHCTRCVRFGQELAGVMELGMIHRGEHAEITTVAGDTVDSELSGNMIDLCPVGALTSKPFRYSARSWELSRRKSVSPHDSTGANLVVQVKGHQVMRVLPLENEAVNECWLADRDRFSYLGLNSDDRLTTPMIRQGGEWQPVDWTTALDYVARSLGQIKAEHGAQAIGALGSPYSTTEELHLLAKLVRGLGSDNIDHRLRHADFGNAAPAGRARWLGRSIASLGELQRVLVVGSFLRKDHPLFALRIREAAKKGAQVHRIGAVGDDWLLPLAGSLTVAPSAWPRALASICAAVAEMPAAARRPRPASRPTMRRARSPGRCCPANARRSCSATPLHSIRRPPRCSRSPTGSASAPAPASATWARPATASARNGSARSRRRAASMRRPCSPAAQARRRPSCCSTSSRRSTWPTARRRCRRSPPATSSSRSRRTARRRSTSPTCCCRPLRSPRPRAPSSTPKDGCRASTASSGRSAETRPAWKVLRVLGNLLGLPGFAHETSDEVKAEALGDLVSADGVAAWPARQLDRRRRIDGASRRPRRRRRTAPSSACPKCRSMPPTPSCGARCRCSRRPMPVPPPVGVSAASAGRLGLAEGAVRVSAVQRRRLDGAAGAHRARPGRRLRAAADRPSRHGDARRAVRDAAHREGVAACRRCAGTAAATVVLTA